MEMLAKDVPEMAIGPNGYAYRVFWDNGLQIKDIDIMSMRKPPILAATIPLDVLRRLVDLASDERDEAVVLVEREIEAVERAAALQPWKSRR
jgi:hypothetical protein